jgi:hypothetical protein
MGVLVAILWALLGLLLLVLLVPFRVGASGAVHDGEPAGSVHFDWGLGLLAMALDSSRRATVWVLWIPVASFLLRPAGERRKERPPRKAKPKREGRPKAGSLRRLRGGFAEREAFQRIALRLARALHLRLRAAGRIGIGDPADTVALSALLVALGRAPGVELAIALDWVDEALELELELAARLWIAELLAVAVLLLLERANWRALRLAFGGAGT